MMQNDTSDRLPSFHGNIATIPIFDVFIVAILTGTMVIGVAGNSLVIYVFGVSPSKKMKRFERFLLLLGVVDLISSIVIPMAFLYLTATGFKRWHFGQVGCKVIPSLLQITVSFSQGVLVVISYERYRSLVKPFNDALSNFKVAIMFATILFVSVCSVLPYMQTLHVVEDYTYDIKTCAPDIREYRTLLISASIQLGRDVFAICIMEIFRYRMTHSLIKQHKKLTWNRRKSSRRGRKLLQMVIIVFSSLTLPVDIFQFIFYALVMAKVPIDANDYDIIIVLNTFLNLLQMSNSVVNVFIYSRMHTTFRLRRFRKEQATRKDLRKRDLSKQPNTVSVNSDLPPLCEVSEVLHYIDCGPDIY